MTPRPFDDCSADENRDSHAVAADKFLFIGLASSGLHNIFDRLLIGGAVFRWRHAGPTDIAGQQIFPRVAYGLKEGVVRIGDAAGNVPEEHADDVGFDEPPDASFALAQRRLGPLALAVLVLQIGIEQRVLQ